MSTLSLGAVPYVLDDDEIPFVLAFAADTRPCLDLAGTQFRRAADRCVIDFDLEPLRLRVVLIHLEDDNTYLLANLGPLFNDWWDLLAKENGNPLRPFLSAGVARRPVTMSGEGETIPVHVVPPSEELDGTTAVLGIGPGLTTETLRLGVGFAPPVIGAALSTLAEYRSLVGEVPEVDIQVGDTSVSLELMLDCAAAAAEAMLWHRVP